MKKRKFPFFNSKKYVENESCTYVLHVSTNTFVRYNSVWTKNDKISDGSSMLKSMAERMRRERKQRKEKRTNIVFANVESPAVSGVSRSGMSLR